MKSLIINAEKREVLGKQNVALRRDDKIPAVMYGRGRPSQSLTIDRREFERVFALAGESSLVEVRIGQSTPVKALIQDVQLHAVTDRILHADLHQVDMAEKIGTEIILSFTGQSPAVHELGGILVTNLEQIKVECLPGDLVHEIVVPLERLKKIDDQIRVADLACPPGITILEKPDTVVAVVTPPRSEEELKALDTEVVEDVASVEAAKPEVEGEAEEATSAVTTEEVKKE